MKLLVGDKVKFLNEIGEGIVSKILSKTTVLVKTGDGFELPIKVSDLVLKNESLKNRNEEENIQLDSTKKMPHVVSPKKRSLGLSQSKPHKKNIKFEIDLHIEELLDDYSKMTNGEIVQIQLSHFNKALNIAISKKYKSLIVIHGVGNGKLKTEVRALASSYDLEFFDASYSKYGYGATEIIIK